jgi:hypothetical protein
LRLLSGWRGGCASRRASWLEFSVFVHSEEPFSCGSTVDIQRNLSVHGEWRESSRNLGI